jgi:hypothetical protein
LAYDKLKTYAINSKNWNTTNWHFSNVWQGIIYIVKS